MITIERSGDGPFALSEKARDVIEGMEPVRAETVPLAEQFRALAVGARFLNVTRF